MANNQHPPQGNDERRLRLLRTLSILLGILVALVLLAGIEGGALWFLHRNGLPTYPFLVNLSVVKGPKAISPMFAKDVYSAYDPHLGYAHNPAATLADYKSLPGFTIYGDGQGVKKTIVIVTLGGSTTDGNVPHIWAQTLQEIMAARGINVQVYNGGVAGYSSSQELIKLIRDVIPLKPDLILSYNGVNDIGLRDVLPKHPMVNRYQEEIMKYLTEEQPASLLPNTMSALRRLPWVNKNKPIKRVVNYGTRVEVSPAENWSRNVRLMHANALEFGIPYICFLQPALGAGAYGETSAAEKDMLKNAEGFEAVDYIKLMKEFYTEARPACDQKDFCEDLVDVFTGQTGIYNDKMHTNEVGNRLVAQAVFDVLLKRYPGLEWGLLQ